MEKPRNRRNLDQREKIPRSSAENSDTENEPTYSTVEEFQEYVGRLNPEELSNFESKLIADMPASLDNELDNYIYGCLSDNSYLGNCSAKCLNSYKPSFSNRCELGIFLKQDGEIIKHNEIRSDKAYLYIDENEDFNKDQIRNLMRKEKIKELYVYKQEEDEYKHISTECYEHKSKKKSSRRKRRSSNNAGLAAAILIFVVLLIIIAILVKRLY